jgi:hypothetical protein
MKAPKQVSSPLTARTFEFSFVVASLAPKEIVIQSSNWKALSLKHGSADRSTDLTIIDKGHRLAI